MPSRKVMAVHAPNLKARRSTVTKLQTHWAQNLQMLFARGGLDREVAPSHHGAMVCEVDTGGGRRYEIRADVGLAVGDVDDNAPFPQAGEMTIEVEERVARKGRLLKGTEWFVEHDSLETAEDGDAHSTDRYRISLPRESSLRCVSL